MQLLPDGAQLFHGVAGDEDLLSLICLFTRRAEAGAGARLSPSRQLRPLLRGANAVAESVLGAAARAVGAKLFDKNPARNWALGWHQDRTIAVRERRDVPGFAQWTIKSGIAHCVPPFTLLERSLTLRVHLDRVGADNAPLLIAPGSHRLGAVAEPDIPAAVSRFGAHACLAEAGDIWAYATPVLHASERARAPTRRRVLQLLYSAETLPGGLEWLGV
jgi:hypothetical protein